MPVQDACERPVSSLDSQIAELKSRRRSPIEFDEWKPSPFYYLYAPVGTIGLLPYGTPVAGTGQAGRHRTLFRVPLLSSRHLQPLSLLGVFQLAEPTPAPEDRIARGSTGSPERLRRPGRMTRPEPGPVFGLF